MKQPGETSSIQGQPVWRSGTRYLPTPLEVLENAWMQYCVLMPREQDGEPWKAFHPVNDAVLEALFASATKEASTALDRFTPKPRQWACGAAFFRRQGRGERLPRATGSEGEGWALVKARTTEAVKQALLGLVQRVQVRSR